MGELAVTRDPARADDSFDSVGRNRLPDAFAGVYRAALHIGALARHRGFAWLIAAWLGVMAVCSAAMYVAEKGANSAIANPFDALWWGVVTLTTVGYGDVYPTTTEGRLAAMCLMLLGIGLFGAITATITSYMMTHELDPAAGSGEPSATDGTTVERVSSAGRTLVSELERLAALHRSGALTAEEFGRAKDCVLAGPGD
jgi:voltage-gated potassium channel Kch